MTKIVYLGLLLTGSITLASETNDSGRFFIGIGATNGSGTETIKTDETARIISGSVFFNTTYNTSSDSFSNSLKQKSVPVTVGYITDGHNRFKISTQNITIDFNQGGSDKISGYDVDFDITLESLGSSKMLPYIGIGVGSYKYDSYENLKGTAFNFNTGLLYKITPRFELDFAFKYKAITWEDTDYSYTTSGTTPNAFGPIPYTAYVNGTESIDTKMGSIYCGLNYKF